jgi:CopG family nickel-responsive transcriptional regulator
MGGVARFGVSLEPQLLKEFDRLLKLRHYTNRSEAVRDLIRAALVEQQWKAGSGHAAGVLTLLYEHESMKLAQRLTHLQHHELAHIITTLHVHLDEHNCLEVLVMRGRAKDLRAAADRLISTRGVKHGKLTMTATGRSLK